MLKFFYVIAILFFILLILFTLDLVIVPSDKTPLLGAIGIIISAFIASLSVMKNIENTNKIEKEKIDKEEKEVLYFVNTEIYNLLLYALPLLTAHDDSSTQHGLEKINSFTQLSDEFKTKHKNIFTEKILSKLDLKAQKEVHIIFNTFNNIWIKEKLQKVDGFYNNKSFRQKLIDDFLELPKTIKSFKSILQDENFKYETLFEDMKKFDNEKNSIKNKLKSEKYS